MKFNKRWLWLIIPLIIFSLCWINSSSVSTVLLAIRGTITDGNLIKFSGSSGVGEDANIASTDVSDAVTKKHSQNTDQYLDYGGGNQVSVSDAKDAVDKKHTQNTDTAAGGEWDFGAHSAGFTLQTTTGDGTTTIDWKLGNKFKFTFGTQADTFTFIAPTKTGNLLLMLVQDGTGGRDATFPASVKWLGTEPTWIDGGGGKTIIMSMFYDGTYYWAQGTPWET